MAANRASHLATRIPKRYRDVSFDRNPVPQIASSNPAAVDETRRFCRSIDDRLDAGDGLWYFGSKGTGKTTLAYLIVRHALEAHRTVASFNAVALFARLKDTYREDSSISTQGFIDHLSTVDLLHIEDLVVTRPTDWVVEQLYLIVNNRYDDERSILFTSDVRVTGETEDEDQPAHNPRVLEETVGPRTFSRLIEMCGDPIPMFGQDRRISRGRVDPGSAAA